MFFRLRGPIFAAIFLASVLSTASVAYAQSTFNPTVLVNTESFEIIDQGDSTTDVELRFGQTAGQKVLYDRTNGRFKITRSLYIAGTLTTTGAAIINVGNTTATPDTGLALEILGTASGKILHAQDILRSSGTLIVRGNAIFDVNTFFVDAANNRVGVLTTAPKTAFEVMGTISGALLTQNGAGNNYFRGSLGIGTTSPDTGVALEIIGTASGNILHAQDQLRSSGTLLVEGNSVLQGSVTFSGITSCTSLQTSSNGAISCGSGGAGNFGTGNVLTIGDRNYVNVSGDTMTGALTILKRAGTATGNTLVVDSKGLVYDATNKRVGVATATPITQFQVGVRVPTTTLGNVSTTTGPRGVAIQGRFAYATRANMFVVVDVTDPTTPTVVSSTSMGTSMREVVAQGRYAYTVDSADGLRVIDISKPLSPKVVGTLAGITALDLVVQGRYLYAIVGNSLRVVDISNPTSPTQVGTVTTNLNGPLDLAIQGRYVYVANYSGNTLLVFDVGNPNNPLNIGSLAITKPRNIAVEGKYVYISNDMAVAVVDVSNPSSMSVAGTTSNFATTSFDGEIKVQGRYVYVTDNSPSSFFILDVGTPTAPTVVGSLTFGSQIEKFAVQGRYAYVGSPGSGILYTLDLGGSYQQNIEGGMIEVSGLSVLSSFSARTGDIRESLQIGRGFISQGPSAVINTSTGATAYALRIVSSSGALQIAAQGNVGQRHINFGSGSLYDVSLFRSAANTLATDGTFVASALTVTGLVNCNTIDTDSNGVLSCGTDEGGAGSGISQTDGDKRYVNAAGDTMTGGLLIQNTTTHGTLPTIDAGVLLEVAGTASGRIIHAQDTLTSSGQLVVTGNVKIDGTTFFADTTNNRIGIGTLIPDTALEVIGTASGMILHAQDQLRSSGTLLVEGNTVLQGSVTFAGITSCTGLQTSSNGAISCANGSSGLTQTSGDLRYVNASGDTMTGGLLIQSTTTHGTLPTVDAGVLLEVAGTESGKSLRYTSGYFTATGATMVPLTVREAVSHSANLTEWQANDGTVLLSIPALSTGNEGAIVFYGGGTAVSRLRYHSGYLDNVNAGQSALYPFRTGDTGVNYTPDGNSGLAVKALDAADRTVFIQGISGQTGYLTEWQNVNGLQLGNVDVNGNMEMYTASGRIIHAQDLLTSSGKLVVTGDVKIDGTTFFANTTTNRVGIGKITPLTTLDVAGTLSGSALTIMNGTSYILGNLVLGGTANPASAKLNVIGTMSGQGLNVGGGATVTRIYSATATLDFANIGTANTCAADLTVSVPGAALGDVVSIGVPNASVNATGKVFAWVSAADTVSVRYCVDATTGNPASGTYRVMVTHF